MSAKRITIAVAITALLITHTSFTSAQTAPTLPTGEDAIVVAVVDGDTIDVTIGGAPFTVRYIGIDAPETKHPSDPVQCFGPEANDANASLAIGQTLRLEKDRTNTDRFGRLLRYAYLPDGRMVNAELVRAGAAFAKRYPPDTKRANELRRAMLDAQKAKRGLWAACKVTNLKTQPLLPAAPAALIAPTATTAPVAAANDAANCSPAYPGVCIPPAPPDLDCGDISYRRFQVLSPDPHRFDRDNDGVGCES